MALELDTRDIKVGSLVRVHSVENWLHAQASLPCPVHSPSGLGRVIFSDTISDVVWVYFKDRLGGTGHNGGLSAPHRDSYGHVYFQSDALEILEGGFEPTSNGYPARVSGAMVANWLHYTMRYGEIAERLGVSEMSVFNIIEKDRLLARLYTRWEDALTSPLIASAYDLHPKRLSGDSTPTSSG